MSSPYQAPTPVTAAVEPTQGYPQRVPPKPVGPIVFGIINLLFGAIGVLGIFGWIATVWLFRHGLGGPNPFFEQMDASPAFRAFTLVTMVLGSLFTLVLLASGVGLLKLAWWGRTLAIAYAVYTLASVIVTTVVNYFMVVSPMMQQAAQNQSPQAAGAMMGAIGGMVGGCAWLIYPLALLIYCLLPSTKQILSKRDDAAPVATAAGH